LVTRKGGALCLHAKLSGAWRHFDSAGIRTSSLGGGGRVAFLAVGLRHVEIDRRKQLAAGIADEVPLTALDNQQRPLP